jgi:hypothetical protein
VDKEDEKVSLPESLYLEVGTEHLITKSMVGLGRFELPTLGLGNQCSIHLSYSPAPSL